MDAELTVRHTIKKHNLINKGDEVLLGLSGGPDSLCLLHILCLLRFEIGFGLSALHLNHKIRGAEADADAEWVKELCGLLCVPLAVYERDIPAMAKELGITEEDAGRRVRHELLKAEAEKTGAKVALAHNRDDQAETVLLHLLRGSGIDGLGGIRPYSLPNAFSETIPLIRPLLGITRAEIEAFAAETGMSFREDRSNTDTAYTRNRIRHDLIPGLKAEYNPQIVQALCRLAESAAADSEFAEAIKPNKKALGFL